MISFSEIETTSKRASKAVGYSWGEAEEVGKSIRLLEFFGLPGIKNLNQYFKKIDKKNFEIIKTLNKKNLSKKKDFCPIILGIRFIDQVKKIEAFKKCSFHRVEYPLLLLPFLSRCSEIIGKKILFTFDGYKFLLNFNVNISSYFFYKKFPSKAKNVMIVVQENENSFSKIEWKNLYKFSEKTFVEENENLKQNAAGAGLTDND